MMIIKQELFPLWVREGLVKQLAILLYNHPEVDDKFELKLWPDISSKDFNISRIFESIAVPAFYPNILLVLDNLSGAQSVNSIYLMDIFNAAEMGSRIIVTTRDEKVGEEYFDELVSRSLIQRRSTGYDKDSFQMHNIIHDLATNSSSQYPIRFDYHRFSYNRGMYDSFNKFDKLYGLYGLRTFLALPIQKPQPFLFVIEQGST